MASKIMTPVRVLPILNFPATLRPILAARCYATQNFLGTTPAAPSGPKRKTVTIFNDDGRVSWGNLSAGEKAARTAQQSFNFGVILIGGIATLGVGYFLFADVFSPNSKTTQFNRAVTRVKDDSRCTDLLGDAKEIWAEGEARKVSFHKSRSRISAHSRDYKDPDGTEHLLMSFPVEGPRNEGTVSLHMIKRPSEYEFKYKYLALDVKGHKKVYLENEDTQAEKKGSTRIFGIKFTAVFILRQRKNFESMGWV